MSGVSKAMVLAAGSGRRLRPLTARLAKPALPLMGRPLIEYVLGRLARQGVGEVVVNLHHFPATVEPSLVRAESHLTVHRSLEHELMGTAGGLKRVASHFADAPFLLLNSDTLVDFDRDALERVHADSGALATLLLRPKPPSSTFTGIRVDDGSRIVSVSRVPGDGDLMFAGVWLLSPDILGWLSGEPVGLESELLPKLVEERAAVGSIQDSSWVTIDTPVHYWSSSLNVARAGLFEEDWNVKPVERVSHGASRSFVFAGEGSRIDSSASFFGAVTLGANCRVGARAELENVVCWDGVEVPPDAKLHNCVVTAGVSLPTGTRHTDCVVMPAGDDRSGLRRREIRDDLVIAHFKSGSVRGL